MRGVYATAAELARLGFIASPTSRSAFGADLLVTDQKCRKAWSIQVKTTVRPDAFCLVSSHAKSTASNSHIYVFVSFKDDKPEFLVVPSLDVARHARLQGTKMMVFDRKNAPTKPGDWSVFGDPRGE